MPDLHPAVAATSGRDAAYERHYLAQWGAMVGPEWAARDWAVRRHHLDDYRDYRTWCAAWAARDAQVGPQTGEVEGLVIALSEYGPVPHQAGCSGAYRPELEKCGADRLNAALVAFWGGQDASIPGG